jgi:endonuclease G
MLAVLLLFILFIRGLFTLNPLEHSYEEMDAAILPVGASDVLNRFDLDVIHHKNFTVGYSEVHEQGVWVGYHLSKEKLILPNVPRTDWFEEDTLVISGSAVYQDYTGSGYTRGHLAPAGDLAHSHESMKESFLMSNISPQMRSFNSGVWRELEECVRDWAYRYKSLYIVTGPVFEGGRMHIGKKNEVAVPSHFYKVVMDVYEGRSKAIGFMIPHEMSVAHLSSYAMAVDEVEARTGLDFFVEEIEDQVEEEVEANFDLGKWPIDEERFLERIQIWNFNE